jgi:hypothetical protein
MSRPVPRPPLYHLRIQAYRSLPELLTAVGAIGSWAEAGEGAGTEMMLIPPEPGSCPSGGIRACLSAARQ